MHPISKEIDRVIVAEILNTVQGACTAASCREPPLSYGLFEPVRREFTLRWLSSWGTAAPTSADGDAECGTGEDVRPGDDDARFGIGDAGADGAGNVNFVLNVALNQVV